MSTILLVLNTILFQAPDALGLVPIESVDVKVEHVFPFYDLKVSQYSSLMFLLPLQLNDSLVSAQPSKNVALIRLYD